MSNATKFTPGPWSVFSKGGFVEVQHCGDDVPVVKWPGFDESFRSLAGHKANAHLIAASPELYRACEVGYTALWAIKARMGAPRTDAEKTAMDELQRRMDILGAALRKARGEA